MDFSPRPRGYNSPSKRLEFDETAAMLLRQVQAVCAHLLPAGRLRNGEWEVGSPAGEPGRSMKVNIKEGLWKDFDSGVGGHDLIALWAEVRGIKMGDALVEAKAWLGVDTGRKVQQSLVAEAITPRVGSTPTPVSTPSHADDDPDWWKKVRATRIWDYFDRDGVLYGQVYRFDDPTGRHKKEIRPWNPATSQWLSPDTTRPLYNLPAILKAPRDAVIVLVEGEKCADAINDLRMPLIVATTCWGGAAAASRTDWSPLAGKRVLRWADNDHPVPGKEVAREVWLRTTLEHLKAANVASLRDVEVDPAMPDGWDAADADSTIRIAHIDRGAASAPVFEGAARVTLQPIRALYHGKEPPPREWLVDGVFPHGRAGLLVAPGDTGKGILLLDLSVKVATPESAGFDANPLTAFGHDIPKRGAVAILAAEDDIDEIHRRLHALYPDLPDAVWDRIYVLPYPDARGRSPTFMAGDIGKVQTTQEMADVYAELKAIPDLVLTIVDPLFAFAAVDMTSSAVAQIVGNTFDKLAKDLGCTVLIAHHPTKGDRQKPTASAADARHMVAGSGQLLNALRFAYAMWPAPGDEATGILAKLNRKFEDNAVFYGAPVKINSPVSRKQKTFVRNRDTGLLEIFDPRQHAEPPPPPVSDELAMLVWCIERWNADDMPVTQTQIIETMPAGRWLRHMPIQWQRIQKPRRRLLVDEAIKQEKLVVTNKSLLALPGDAYALGPEGGGRAPTDIAKGTRKVLVYRP
jgi:hypothetical protein